ncbi:MAG: hypothetical protein FWD73_06455 [Polyangiaceae bacterium]|nr:hypothetical protein [Polyangiaceae bacterium]
MTMIWIVENPAQWIKEGSRCLLERDAVLPLVGRRLGSVPLERQLSGLKANGRHAASSSGFTRLSRVWAT